MLILFWLEPVGTQRVELNSSPQLERVLPNGFNQRNVAEFFAVRKPSWFRSCTFKWHLKIPNNTWFHVKIFWRTKQLSNNYKSKLAWQPNVHTDRCASVIVAGQQPVCATRSGEVIQMDLRKDQKTSTLWSRSCQVEFVFSFNIFTALSPLDQTGTVLWAARRTLSILYFKWLQSRILEPQWGEWWSREVRLDRWCPKNLSVWPRWNGSQSQ